MKKSTKTIIIIIGILSILSGLYGLLSKGASFNTYSGIFIGIVLLGALYFDNKESNKTGKS